MKRIAVAFVIGCGLLLATAPAASAHPLGNFTINQYSGLRIGRDAVQIDLVVDMAEIPTFQLRKTIDSNHDGEIDDGESATWRGNQCQAEARSVELRADDKPMAIEAASDSSLSFRPGQASLPTLRLECQLRARLLATTQERTIEYRNNNFDGRLGWREIVAIGDLTTTLTGSDVPAVGTTDRLTQYPANLLSSPLDQRSATIRFVARSSIGTDEPPAQATPAVVRPRGVDRATRAFTDLVGRQKLTLGFGLLAILLAIVLGGIHALAPGHGKTVLAAYIVGEHGSLRQAAAIGITVTATHTAGVITLGILLTSSTAIAPEHLYPWLGLLSGLLVASIGVTLGRRAMRMRRWLRASPVLVAHTDRQPAPIGALAGGGHAVFDHDHEHHDHEHHDHEHHDHEHHDHEHHDHEHHDHEHHDHEHHDHEHHDHEHHDHQSHGVSALEQAHSHGGRLHTHKPIDPTLGWRSLITVGFAGGLVPSPSALVVLLGAIALGRTWFGLLLVTAYGIGMAATLTGVGLILVRARKYFDRQVLSARRASWITRISSILPVASAVVIVLAGFALVARALVQL